MDFSFSEELLEIKRIARDFAEKEIRPHVMEWDEKQIFPRDVLKKLAELISSTSVRKSSAAGM